MTGADIARDGDQWTEFAREVEVEPLSETIAKFLAYKDLDSLLFSNVGHFPRFMDRLSETLRRAFEENCHRSLFQVHKALYYLYEDNIRKPQPGACLNQYHPFVIRLRNEIEKAWEAFELQRIDLTLEEIPSDEGAFVRFLKTRCFSHRVATHPLFDFLEKDATYDEIVSFFMHEGVLILRFCDLIVLSMLGVDEEVRAREVERSVIREDTAAYGRIELLRRIEAEMLEAADALDFERAAEHRDRLRYLQTRALMA